VTRELGLLPRLSTHLFALWGPFWFVPLLPAVYTLVVFLVGDLRWEHVAFSVTAAALGLSTKSTKAFFVLALPGILMAWGDDAIRYLRPVFVTSNRIIGCAMRNAELKLFAAGPNETFSDYFAIHHASLFDVLAAIPYGIFWMIPIGYACYLFFNDKGRLSHYLWALLVTQAVVWIVWMAIPTAPPWYIRLHGCSIDANAAPSAAALLRVDHLFGMNYFQSFYSRGATTFGAMPSMHCAFPMIGLLTAWRATTWKTRPLHLLYAASMIWASVYLDHHWVLDGLAAWLVSAAAVVGVGTILRLGQPKWFRQYAAPDAIEASENGSLAAKT
jgi:inositol phosphorylceramide synthase catalytic subunit